MFTTRPDGVLLTRLPGVQKAIPYLMPTRTGASIEHQQTMRVTKAMALLERLNQGRSERRYTLSHIVIAAGVRLMAERPENNRFVSGYRIYQRKEIAISFVAKRQLTEDAAETTVKVVFEPTDTLEQVAERVWALVKPVKESAGSRDEDLAETVTRLPRFLTRIVFWGWRVLDYLNLLPAAWIRSDAFYCSAFLANLGSIGLEAVKHHLFDWGTCSFFAVIGKVRKVPASDARDESAVEDVLSTCFTVDERITDGVNLARSIEKLTGYIENPERLLVPPEAVPDPFRFA